MALRQRGACRNKAEQDPFLDLRRRAFGMADSLARRFGITELVAPLPDCGHGFLINAIAYDGVGNSDGWIVGDRVDAESETSPGTGPAGAALMEKSFALLIGHEGLILLEYSIRRRHHW